MKKIFVILMVLIFVFGCIQQEQKVKEEKLDLPELDEKTELVDELVTGDLSEADQNKLIDEITSREFVYDDFNKLIIEYFDSLDAISRNDKAKVARRYNVNYDFADVFALQEDLDLAIVDDLDLYYDYSEEVEPDYNFTSGKEVMRFFFDQEYEYHNNMVGYMLTMDEAKEYADLDAKIADFDNYKAKLDDMNASLALAEEAVYKLSMIGLLRSDIYLLIVESESDIVVEYYAQIEESRSELQALYDEISFY